jgi:hypothetical protein
LLTECIELKAIRDKTLLAYARVGDYLLNPLQAIQ